MKAIWKVLMVLALVLVFAGAAYAQPIEIEYLKINGDEFDAGTNHSESLVLQRGDDIDIKIRLHATDSVENLQAEADIYGYKYSEHEESLVSDTSDVFDMDAGDVKYIELHLQVPTKMDKDYTKLRIRIATSDGPVMDASYQLRVEGVADEDAIIIKDYSFSPSNEVVSGRAFTATVKVKNIGDDDLDDVKVTVSVPELNIQDSEYMDEINADESETFEELLLRIPECAKSGTYEVRIEVEFDEYESTMATDTIRVVQDDTCTAPATQVGDEKTIITVPTAQDVKSGATVVYPIMITNTGTKTKSYTLTVSGVDALGTVRMTPSSVVLVNAGKTETAYLYLDTKAGAAQGDAVFVVNVLSSDGESKQIPLTAKVTGKAAGETTLLKGLQIGLIVLVIILIIIGLIIGFNKLRKEEGPEEETQTYY